MQQSGSGIAFVVSFWFGLQNNQDTWTSNGLSWNCAFGSRWIQESGVEDMMLVRFCQGCHHIRVDIIGTLLENENLTTLHVRKVDQPVIVAQMSQVVLLQASHFVILEFGCLQLIIRDGLRIHNSHVVILDAGRASIPRGQVQLDVWWVFNMGVSQNGGTQQWMVYKGKSYSNA